MIESLIVIGTVVVYRVLISFTRNSDYVPVIKLHALLVGPWRPSK